MRKLKLLIWNDRAKEGEAWKKAAIDDEFEKVRIEVSNDTAPQTVVAKYLKWRPDVTILDLWDTKAGRALGLEIAAEIHKQDRLAPLIAVTSRPREAYTTDGYLRWQGFSGVYPAELTEARGQFKDIIVAESLVLKHLLQPEYVLARECSLSLLSKEWGDSRHIIEELAAAIQRLPFSGPIDGWHAALARAIHDALRARGWNRLADRYKVSANLFQRSDPFYMAGSRSRRHLSHNVQVCLLGLSTLLADGSVQDAAVKQMSSLLDAVLVWVCIGTVHDAAYLSQYLAAVSTELSSVSNGFGKYVGVKDPISPWIWPTTHHAEVGALMWGDPNTDAEGNASRSISKGIADHDAKRPGTSIVELESDWQSFLAILCDELQDWQRTRPEAGPGIDPWNDAPWRLVEPLRFELTRESDVSILSLDLMVVDHPRIVQDMEGAPNIAPISKRFLEILDTLEQKLSCQEPFEVRLAAHFVTRRVPAVYQTRRFGGS